MIFIKKIKWGKKSRGKFPGLKKASNSRYNFQVWLTPNLKIP